MDKSETSPYVTKNEHQLYIRGNQGRKNPGGRRTEYFIRTVCGRYFGNKISRNLKYTFHPKILLDISIDYFTVGTNEPTIYHDFKSIKI